jgi:hypothetical protein
MKKAQSNNLIIMFVSIVVIALLFIWIFGYQKGSLAKFFGIFKHSNNTIEGFDQDKKCDVETNNYRYVMKPILSDTENIIYYETCDFNDLQKSYEGILNGTINNITDSTGTEVTIDKSNIKVEVYNNDNNADLLLSIDFNDIANEPSNIYSLYYISTNIMKENENEIKKMVKAILDSNDINYNTINVYHNKPSGFTNIEKFNDQTIFNIFIKYNDWEVSGSYNAQILFNTNITNEVLTSIFNIVTAYLFELDNTIINIRTTNLFDSATSSNIEYTPTNIPKSVSDLVNAATVTNIENIIAGITTTTAASEGTTTTSATASSGGTTTTSAVASGGTTTTSADASGGTTTTAAASSGGTTTTSAVASGGTTTTAAASSGGTTTTSAVASEGTTTTASGGTTTTTTVASGGTTTTDPGDATTEAERQQEILDQLAQLYNNDSELSQEMIDAVKTLPPNRRETICRDYCNYMTTTNTDFCDSVECENDSPYSIQSQLAAATDSRYDYAQADGIYSLLDPKNGSLEDYLQSGIYKHMFEDGSDQRIPHFVNQMPNRASSTNIIQKDTEGVSNIFAPNIFVMPKRNGEGYASYIANDPNDPSYRDFINNLVSNY